MYIQGKFKVASDDLTDIFEIRRKVFIEEQGIPCEEEFDTYDNDAVFCVVYEPKEMKDDEGKEEVISVATGRLVLLEDGRYKIGRVAVLKEYRGRKYGDMVVKMLVNKAFMSGAMMVYISSQISAKGFYQTIGFEEYGEIYMEAGIEHIGMILYRDKLCTSCGHKN
jgi:predicted GNAT family N-acyltransferase